MKIMNRKTHFVVAFAALQLLAPLRASAEDLKSISDGEKQWSKAELSIDGRTEKVKAVVTQTGNVRITEVPGRFSGRAQLEVPGYKNESVFKGWCEDTSQAFPVAKTDSNRNKYTLRVELNPFAKKSVFRGSNGNLVTVENPVTLTGYRPDLVLGAGAVSYEQTRINTNEFSQFLSQQIDKQLSEVQASGVVALDLTGWDDVVCDLSSGHAVLNLNLSVRFETPFVQRETVVSREQVSGMYNDLKNQWKPRSSVLENHIVGAALLGASVAKNVNKSVVDLGFSNFVSLHLKLFEILSGNLKPTDDRQAALAARDLDKVSRPTQSVYTTVTPILTFKPVKTWRGL